MIIGLPEDQLEFSLNSSLYIVDEVDDAGALLVQLYMDCPQSRVKII